MALVHIALEGVPGSGKTALGSSLEKLLRPRLMRGLPEGIQVRFFEENVENPYLKDFYNRSLRSLYSFFSQSFFLHARILKEVNIACFPGIAIEDRSLLGDLLLAKNLFNRGEMSPEAFDFYCKQRKELTKLYKIGYPDGIVFLDISLETCIEQRLNDRKSGEDLDSNYWGDVIKLYRAEFENVEEKMPGIELIRVDANPDFTKDENYVMNVTDEINKLIKRILKKKNSEGN